jgi:RimJ/RimL family protein N-acetyltransferase
VRLEPTDVERDARPLFLVSNGEPIRLGERYVESYDAEKLIWRYLPYGPFATESAFANQLRALADGDRVRAFTVFDSATDHQVGSLCLSANVPEHLKVEIAHVWYSAVVQRTLANLESTYLLLRHAFGLGYQRVEWKCDSLNERSRRSALRMGFRFEGIQDSHYIVKGRNRDTAWFRILAREWPEIRIRLEAMLKA